MLNQHHRPSADILPFGPPKDYPEGVRPMRPSRLARANGEAPYLAHDDEGIDELGGPIGLLIMLVTVALIGAMLAIGAAF